MPRTVILQLVGLGVVVEDGDVAKVLLPVTSGHHAGLEIPPHRAVLCRKPLPTGDPNDWLDFAGGVLRVSRSGHRRPTKAPAQLVDLRAFSDEGVSAELLSGPIDTDHLTGRVELDIGVVLGGGERAEYVFVSDSSAGGGSTAKRVIMATQVQAAFELGDDEALTVVREVHENGQKVGEETVQPPVENDSILLRIFHVPHEDLPPNVPPASKDGQEIPHFDVYWRFYESPRSPARVWLLDQEPRDPQEMLVPVIGSTKTCPTVRAT